MSLTDIMCATVPDFDAERLVSLIIVTDGFSRTAESVRGIVMHHCVEPAADPFIMLFGNEFSQELQEIESIPEYMIDRQCSLEQAKQSADCWLHNTLGEGVKPIFVASGFYGWTDTLCKAITWKDTCDSIDLRQLYSLYRKPDQALIGQASCKALLVGCSKPPQRFGLNAIEAEIGADHISIGIKPVVRAYSTSAQTLAMLTRGA